ncbi:hypothetical protein [Rahnella sikkimica]|uniref:Phage tail protein n=1 Tax=Rahnella sikkimica TaxID=1805933 RepID=A0A2L1UPH3_9GAMM|nr:hypothetical protein BV494_07750 [Rahnella sikkimica]
MQKIGNITTTADANGEWTNGNVAAGTPPTILDAAWLNTVQRELASVVTGGGLVLDPTNDAQVLAALKLLIKGGVTGVVGEARNAKMSVTTASATATFTADELIVGTALGGLQYRIGSFSKTINLATNGAGGMDTGSAPASGYVALYAIYNPTTGTSALLAVNATAAVAPTVYGGANMPAGYTASALISVFGTNASGLIKPFIQAGRHIDIPATGVFSSTTKTTVNLPTSLATAVPRNAISFDMVGNLGSDTQTGITANLYADNVVGTGQHQWGSSLAWGVVTTFYAVSISVAQTIYYNFSSSSGTLSISISVSGYSF